MKKTLTFLTMALAAGFAWGDVDLTLPASAGGTWVTRTADISSETPTTYINVVNTVATEGVGVYVMGNNGAPSGGTDGAVSGDSIVMWARSGAKGESAAIVLDASALTGVENLTSISVSTSAAVLSNTTNSTMSNYGVILAAVGADGTVLGFTTGTASQTAGVSLSLDVTDWAAGNKVVLGFVGVNPNNVNYPYDATITISDISVKGVTAANDDPASPNVPEPATATLSLLALAGLCARRRRK